MLVLQPVVEHASCSLSLKMTSDKHNNGHLAKPFTPTLSAAFHRTNKSPLTPKLANPSSGVRRVAHPENAYSTPSKDDLSSILSANVTPRSGSRNTRRDGALTSPTNTPSSAPSPQSQSSQLGHQNGGARTERSPARLKLEQSRSLRAKTLTAEGQSAVRPHSVSDLPARMFFHASDTRSPNASDVDVTRSNPQGKMSPASSFVYANGDEEQQSEGKEFNTPAVTARRRSGGHPRQMAATKPSPSPRLTREKDATSPPTDDSRSQISLTTDPPQRHGSSLSMVPDEPQPPSIGRHTKSYSIDSANYSIHPRESLRSSPIIVSPSNFHGDSTAPVMPDQIPILRPCIFSDGSSISADAQSSLPQNPGKSDGPSAPAGEMALNARTERKIQDLEISNSSLLAINRTLEREMRRQNAELRRYRRLSRSGRLSMAPSMRSVSGTTLSVTSELEEGTSEPSSIRSLDESECSDEDSVADESMMSPDSLAEHDAKHRAHDERRVLIDLARHQELLVDSQKMNQSLKRCLGWTEELIKEGRKALEYSVHVHDIELGGRVLAPEELGEVGESNQGLLSPSAEFSATSPSDDPASDDPADPAS